MSDVNRGAVRAVTRADKLRTAGAAMLALPILVVFGWALWDSVTFRFILGGLVWFGTALGLIVFPNDEPDKGGPA